MTIRTTETMIAGLRMPRKSNFVSGDSSSR
jgi:hypothetical protein